MMTIAIHSIINLITNSSTEIFTYSEYSVQAVKDLLNEILSVFNINESIDDMFEIKVTMHDYNEDNEIDIDLDEDIEYYEYPRPSTTLRLIPKKDKYEQLGNKLIEFLYSTQHEAIHT